MSSLRVFSARSGCFSVTFALQMFYYYLLVFVAALLVDLVPFVGPPAWMAMVFLQMKYGLNIWPVLVAGVIGSALGRYLLSLYIPALSGRFISVQKQEDIEFIGEKLGDKGWRVRLFVFLYTLVPLPSTPLFTAAGMARISAVNIIPSFLGGKFISDMIMVLSGDYAVRNATTLASGFWSWKSVSGAVIGVLIIIVFLGIDWRMLLQSKKFRLNFRIWK